MLRSIIILVVGIVLTFCQSLAAEDEMVVETEADRVEIKLIDALDDERGWCVHLLVHLTRALPLGGCHAPIGARPPKNNEGISQIRRLTFETCSEANDKLQRWEFRNGDYQPAQTTEPHRYFIAE